MDVGLCLMVLLDLQLMTELEGHQLFTDYRI